MEIKILCSGKDGGAYFYAFNYEEKNRIIEECEKEGLTAEVVEVKL
jgi:hypothetical protein